MKAAPTDPRSPLQSTSSLFPVEVSLKEIMDFAQHTSKAIATKDVTGMLQELDADGDGHLSLEEHLAASGAGEAGEDTEEPGCVGCVGDDDQMMAHPKNLFLSMVFPPEPSVCNSKLIQSAQSHV